MDEKIREKEPQGNDSVHGAGCLCSSSLRSLRTAMKRLSRKLDPRTCLSVFFARARAQYTRPPARPLDAADVTALLVLENQRPFAISPRCDVYKARHRSDGAPMVIRRIRFSDDEDAWNVKLRAAASHLVLARDECVLAYIGICYHDGSLCIASAFASGGDLKTYLRTNPDCDRVTLLRQVSDGLNYLHRIGIVHGKIHTRNILLDDRNTAKLSDFGTSELIPDEGATSMRPAFAREKALYCAPELHQGARLVASCDVYSFGVLVFHVFCGKEPMIDSYPHTIQAVAALLNDLRPKRQEITRSDFSDDLWDLSQRCWAPSVESRPLMATVQLELRVRRAPQWQGPRSPPLRSPRG